MHQQRAGEIRRLLILVLGPGDRSINRLGPFGARRAGVSDSHGIALYKSEALYCIALIVLRIDDLWLMSVYLPTDNIFQW